ncbi:hypothetical protein ACFSCX_06890 [Bacillus salitolerans]|uniref:Uncharacterized protein n=1 Tax=Bacillus salitolerans TaxID=1437434 RepID=A0ABW4LMH5_9BACI
MEQNRPTEHGPTIEDTLMMDNYIVLITLIKVVDHDLRQISASDFKMGTIYEAFFEKLLNRILKDIKELKTAMKKKGIVVRDRVNRDKEYVYWPYLCRGYSGNINRWIYALKSQCNEKLREYLDLKESDSE